MSCFAVGETKRGVEEADMATILSWQDSPTLKLGEGSFGSVFAGTDDRQRAVAIKLLGKEQRKNAHLYGRMFHTEVNILSRFHHPNIIKLYRHGKAIDGTHQMALVYERIATDLAHEIQKGNTFTAADRLNIAIDTARGLTFMHGQETVESKSPTTRVNGMAEHPCWHRDIKSANIGITKDRRGKLLDCGIAKSRIDVVRTMMTVTGGGQLGTPGYIAPEVVQSGRYGTQSEIYAFGVVLLELLTTKKATYEDGLVSFVQEAAEEQEEWIDHSCGWPSTADVPAMERFRGLVLCCVKTSKKRRPATMRDVMLQLIQIKNDLVLSSGAPSFSTLAPAVVDAANDIANLSREDLMQRLRDLKALQNQLWSDSGKRGMQQQEEHWARAAAAAAQQTTCCICQDSVPQDLGVSCSLGHFTCNDCLEGHVLHQLPQHVNSPDFNELARQNRPDGSMYCPCRATGDCAAPAFSDSELCRHVQPTTFQEYLTVKMKVGEHRVFERQNAKWTLEFQRIQQEMKEKGVKMDRNLLAEQLQRQFPNAYQCGRCGHGPIDHTACSGESHVHGPCGVYLCH